MPTVPSDAEGEAGRERALLLGLAKLALSGVGREELVAETLRCAAATAGTDLAKLMEETAEGAFRATAGLGWAAGEVVGRLEVPGGAEGSPSSRAFASGLSVHSGAAVDSGGLPAAIVALGVGSSLDTPVGGLAGPHGVLQVDRRSGEAFSDLATHRVEGMATLLGYALDARAREATEAARIAAAHALLVREVDHRVANSLSLVAGTLRLQARAVDKKGGDPAPLLDAAARIGGIAMLHRHLQRTATAGSAEVDVNALLRDLAHDLATLLQLHGLGGGLAYEAEPESGVLWPAKRASAVCLIAAELVTNAARHGGQRATLRMKAAEREIVLTVTDDGPGFPPGFDPETEGGLGSQLIRGLAGPGTGRIAVARARGRGARVTVRVSLDPA